MKYKIYAIEIKDSGEYYVGQTSRSVEERVKDHQYGDTDIAKAIQRGGAIYGKIDETSTLSKALELEIQHDARGERISSFFPNDDQLAKSLYKSRKSLSRNHLK